MSSENLIKHFIQLHQKSKSRYVMGLEPYSLDRMRRRPELSLQRWGRKPELEEYDLFSILNRRPSRLAYL